MLFSATYVFPVSQEPIQNGIVEVDANGKILAVYSPETFKGDLAKVKYYDGILCPGFINVHCHLELSHLKGKVAQGAGLDEFIKQIEKQRTASEEEIAGAMEKAEEEMIANGIVAVGDISNTSHSFLQKSRKKLYYYTFIELLGFHPEKAERAFAAGLKLLEELGGNGGLTLHAPYSASIQLLKKISDWAVANDGLLTMHNQENEDENKMFLEKKGKIIERLQQFGINTDFFEATGKSSMRSALEHLPVANKLLLVHNTFTGEEDLRWAKAQHPKLYWCFCPNANLYIEGKLPDIPRFVENDCVICIGSDSLASNWGLSILEELKSIQKYFGFPLHSMLPWATGNGASFLGIEKYFGSIEPGKTPGLNLITHCLGDDITAASKLVKLV
jgi:cytosine/adenosine deaminase-related metal-dependent hydrolase